MLNLPMNGATVRAHATEVDEGLVRFDDDSNICLMTIMTQARVSLHVGVGEEGGGKTASDSFGRIRLIMCCRMTIMLVSRSTWGWERKGVGKQLQTASVEFG